MRIRGLAFEIVRSGASRFVAGGDEQDSQGAWSSDSEDRNSQLPQRPYLVAKRIPEHVVQRGDLLTPDEDGDESNYLNETE